MPDIVFQALKYGFLLVLYLFLVFALRTVYVEVLPLERRQRAAMKPARASKAKKAHLQVLQSEDKIGPRIALDKELSVGRSPQCLVRLHDDYVSQMHARLHETAGRYYVEDMGSTNGTYVNGRKITYPTELRPGDRIKIGKTILEFRR
ncbi:MAG: FHA domain-containing protein [Candidatus Geothermincolia bacterium]